MKVRESSKGVELRGESRTRGLLIAAGSLALLWALAFLKGRVESDLET